MDEDHIHPQNMLCYHSSHETDFNIGQLINIAVQQLSIKRHQCDTGEYFIFLLPKLNSSLTFKLNFV